MATKAELSRWSSVVHVAVALERAFRMKSSDPLKRRGNGLDEWFYGHSHFDREAIQIGVGGNDAGSGGEALAARFEAHNRPPAHLS